MLKICKKKLFLCLWFSLSSSAFLFGGTSSVPVPPSGIMLFYSQISYEDYNSYHYKGTGRRSFLEHELEQRGHEEKNVSGEISVTQVVHTTSLHYGLAQNYSLSIEIPYYNHNLRSDLIKNSVDASQDVKINDFIEEFSTKQISGIGDVRIGVMQRLAFSDELDWRFGAKFSLSAKKLNVNELLNRTEVLKGNNAFVLYMQWLFYSLYSNNRYTLRLEHAWNVDSHIAESTQYTGTKLRRGNEVQILGAYDWIFERHLFGLGLQLENKGDIKIENQQYRFSEMNYRLKAYWEMDNLLNFQWNNLIPYQFGIEIYQTVNGLNSPNKSGLLVNGTLYF